MANSALVFLTTNFSPHRNPNVYALLHHKTQISSFFQTLSHVVTLLLSLSRTMEINLDGLTFSDGGITLNMEADGEHVTILDHCLI